MRNIVTVIAIGASFAAAVNAQEPKEPKDPAQRVERDVIKMVGPKDGMIYERSTFSVGGDVHFISTEGTIAGKVVKGAPYSADIVNERTQTLSDGNRITQKSTTSTYRDSEGRTRREMALPAIGQWSTGADAPAIVIINDPVANTSYHLETKNKIARKLPVEPMGLTFTAPVAAGEFGTHVAGEAKRADRPSVGLAIRQTSGAPVEIFNKEVAPPKTENLGKQAIDGIEVEGTRTTITIPSGEIGNEREINIVSERWYSPELQTVIQSTHSDPRMGDTVVKLTNIRRGDPHPALFQVPADYKIEEGTPGVRMLRKIEK